MTQDILSLTALEQAALLRARTILSEELVRLYLARIARFDAELSAFVQVFARRAIADAREKDKILKKKNGVLPPFFGVPIGIKDLNFVRFSSTRFGTRALPPIFSPIDDNSTRALRRGGFVILGKMTTSEFGAMPVTEPDGRAPTRNPYNLAHSSGGSSGGSGAAVAAGLLPIAHGSDGAGSIRIPSAFCHLYGLKPSRGRVRDAFGSPDQRILYTCGPIARSVEDAAAMLDVMSGFHGGKPHWAPLPSESFASSLARSLTSRRTFRVRMVLSSPVAETDPEIVEAVKRVALVLEQLGHHVEEGAPPEGSLAEFLPLWQHLVGSMPGSTSARAQAVTRWLARAGKKLDTRNLKALHTRLEERLLREVDGCDLWISPTVPTAAPKVGAYANLEPGDAFHRAAACGAYTAVFNITGQPAASFPIGLNQAGLPIGLQIAGRPFADADVLALSKQLEEALPFRDMRPAFSG